LKNLLLMRHGDAQSASAVKGRDHDRPLTSRGREKCIAIARYLAQHDMLPETILASSATRCIQTAETLLHSLDLSLEIGIVPELYQASPDTYLATIHQVPDQLSNALIIGHNPTIQGFAHAMRKTGVEVGSFNCAAIVCMSLTPQAWGETSYHSGNCLWFVAPGDSGLL
jgi:phosphohistidine phosphatase